MSDKKNDQLSDERAKILHVASVLIEHYVEPQQFEEKFKFLPPKNESIYLALVSQKIAQTLDEAIVMVGRAFPPPSGSTWTSLALWVIEYDSI